MHSAKYSLSSKNSYSVSFTLYKSEQALSKNITILIASAMAVPQRYYRYFSEYLCDKGYNVITFDYLGVGESLIHPKDRSVLYEDWGKYDVNLLINWIDENLKTPIYYIAHSAGGQILGLAPNSTKIAKIFIISSGISYWKNWPFPRRYFYLLAWYVFYPAIIKVFGYSPKFAMGEVVPGGIMNQWLYWARKKRFMLDDQNTKIYFEDISADIDFIAFSDDTYSPYNNAKILASFFINSKVNFRLINPREFNYKKIGHFGFFRNRFKDDLWPLLNL